MAVNGRLCVPSLLAKYQILCGAPWQSERPLSYFNNSTVTTHEDGQDCKNDGLICKSPVHDTVRFILVARNESITVMS